jgi:hypothetical protein
VQKDLMDHFELQFRKWLEDALAEGIPGDVIAFAFNLFEQPSNNARYGVEFVGTSEFDRNDPDWACSETWEPSNGRHSDIPLSFCDGSWEICLSEMSRLISSFLQETSPLAQKLGSVRGIGIGFVDGELLLLKAD